MPGRTQSERNFYHQKRTMTRNIGGHGGHLRPHNHQQQQHHHLQQQQQQHNMAAGQDIREACRARKDRKNMDSYLADDQNFPSFKSQLEKMGLQLRDIPADGNCLFRALGDQLEGHCRNHFKHRTDVVNFMKHNRPDFEPFVEDDVTFDNHVSNLQRLGTHAGNDAIVAFAKYHGVNVVIHQLNGEPLMIQGPMVGPERERTRQLHIAYHNGDHYSSVRKFDDNTESPAHIRWCQSDKDSAKTPSSPLHNDSSGVVSVKRGLEDIETEVMVATQCMDITRIREVLMDYNYDVEASIADLLQQMELTGEATTVEDSASLASHQTLGDSGVWSTTMPADTANSTSTTSTKVNGQGKGHKVHFREDSFGGNSSGYGSVSSNKEGGARPKLVPSQRKMKETKKMEKKRRAEERHRQKMLGGGVGPGPAQHYDYGMANGRAVDDERPPVHEVTLHGGRLTSI